MHRDWRGNEKADGKPIRVFARKLSREIERRMSLEVYPIAAEARDNDWSSRERTTDDNKTFAQKRQKNKNVEANIILAPKPIVSEFFYKIYAHVRDRISKLPVASHV